eukprot:gene10655-11814_t
MNTVIGRTLRYQARVRVQLHSCWRKTPLVSPQRKLSTTAPSPSPSAPQPAASSPSRADKVIDFIENNGGKLFLFAAGVVAGLIYRYYEGLQDRNRVEEQVERGSMLEPYEIQMLRLANGYDLDQYKQMIQAMVKQGLSWDSSIGYDEVIHLVSDTIRQQDKSSSSTTTATTLKLGHLIDRVVYGKALKGSHESKVPVAHFPLSVAFTVGLLALPMESNVDNRLHGLFYASTSLTGREEMTRSDLIEVIQSLVESDQIPSEKQIEETGEKYPIRRHRRRSPENMVKMYEEQILKATNAKESWNETDFVACIASRYVCAWGACYRGNNH